MTTNEILNLCGLSAKQKNELVRDMKKQNWVEVAASKYGWDEPSALSLRKWVLV